jgi:hypothetical protein
MKGAIVFDFENNAMPSDACNCQKFGWIQHVKGVGLAAWRYDNGTPAA